MNHTWTFLRNFLKNKCKKQLKSNIGEWGPVNFDPLCQKITESLFLFQLSVAVKNGLHKYSLFIHLLSMKSQVRLCHCIHLTMGIFPVGQWTVSLWIPECSLFQRWAIDPRTLCRSAILRPAHISRTTRFQSSVSVFRLASNTSTLPEVLMWSEGIRRSRKEADAIFTSCTNIGKLFIEIGERDWMKYPEITWF